MLFFTFCCFRSFAAPMVTGAAACFRSFAAPMVTGAAACFRSFAAPMVTGRASDGREGPMVTRGGRKTGLQAAAVTVLVFLS